MFAIKARTYNITLTSRLTSIIIDIMGIILSDLALLCNY